MVGDACTGKDWRLWWGASPNRFHHEGGTLARPLYWLKSPKRMSDERLIEHLTHVLVQLRNRTHQEDDEARAWLESLAVCYLEEIERRIAQGTLF